MQAVGYHICHFCKQLSQIFHAIALCSILHCITTELTGTISGPSVTEYPPYLVNTIFTGINILMEAWNNEI